MPSVHLNDRLTSSPLTAKCCRNAFAASDGQQLQVLRSRSQLSAERPRLTCHAEATIAQNRSTFYEEGQPEEVEVEQTYVDEGALVKVLDEYDEADERTLPVSLLSDEETYANALASVHENAELYYHAFFSSELGGVTMDKAFMQIPMDDHLVHRGHGVFDTALIVNGYAYMLDEHLERLWTSAKKAAIPLPVSIKQLKRIILETVAVSMKMNGLVRFWLGAGRGNFGISSSDCLGSTFYCLMTTLPDGDPIYHPGNDYLRGRKVVTSSVPIKDPYFATLKSVNYLPNALACMDGEQQGVDYGVFVDSDGNLAEGPNMNMIILTQEGELLVPPFTQTLAGLTLRRIMELIPEQLEELKKDTGGALQAVRQRTFNKWDVFDAKEAMLVGSTTYVTSILQFDGKEIGDGAYGSEPGIVSLTLRAMLLNDMNPEKGPRRLFTEVPYGFLTNMAN